MVKNCLPMQEQPETQIQPLGGAYSLKESKATPTIFSPRESPGQRSLADYSPQGLKESDMTEVTAHTHNQYKL